MTETWGVTITVSDFQRAGVRLDQLGDRGTSSIGGYLQSIPAVRDWLAEEMRPGDVAYVLGSDEEIPLGMHRRSLTIPLEKGVFDRFTFARGAAAAAE